MVVNDNGDVREANLYMGYGKIVPLYSQNGYSKVRDKFTGKEFDTESGLGLFYFGARYYDPDLGVWTSPDPMDQYWDAYSYCGADPVNYVDEW